MPPKTSPPPSPPMELVGSPTDHATRRQSAQGASMLFLAVAGAWLLAWRKRRLWRARTTRKIIMTLGMERVHGGRIIVTLDGSAMDGKSGKSMMTLASCFSQVEGNWKKKPAILLLQKEIWSNPWQFLVFVRNDEWWIFIPLLMCWLLKQPPKQWTVEDKLQNRMQFLL